MCTHHTESHFEPHKELFELAGETNAPFFAEFIRPTDCVPDFGCSASYLLPALPGADKRGVEINPSARKVAVISTETNSVVTARSRELKMRCIQSCDDKRAASTR